MSLAVLEAGQEEPGSVITDQHSLFTETGRESPSQRDSEIRKIKKGGMRGDE